MNERVNVQQKQQTIDAYNDYFVDVLDLSWSPHDKYLASSSVDNTVIVWNAQKYPGMQVHSFLK